VSFVHPLIQLLHAFRFQQRRIKDAPHPASVPRPLFVTVGGELPALVVGSVKHDDEVAVKRIVLHCSGGFPVESPRLLEQAMAVEESLAAVASGAVSGFVQLLLGVVEVDGELGEY
jgi:hypothetical protein